MAAGCGGGSGGGSPRAGVAVTVIYAHVKGWTITAIATDAWAGGLAAALVIGALAGLLRAQGGHAVSHGGRGGPSDAAGRAAGCLREIVGGGRIG